VSSKRGRDEEAGMRALVAVDGSVNAAVVMHAVAPWLRASGSTAEVLTVLDESEIRATREPEAMGLAPSGIWPGSALPSPDGSAAISEERRQALEQIQLAVSEQLRDLVSEHLVGIDCDVRVLVARHAPNAIIAEARRTKADTIAMGTRGRGSLTSLVLGGSAHQVVMAAPVPVFLVRA
jgi:nucleotide-binding universal stress UspA family protein